MFHQAISSILDNSEVVFIDYNSLDDFTEETKNRWSAEKITQLRLSFNILTYMSLVILLLLKPRHHGAELSPDFFYHVI